MRLRLAALALACLSLCAGHASAQTSTDALPVNGTPGTGDLVACQPAGTTGLGHAHRCTLQGVVSGGGGLLTSGGTMTAPLIMSSGYVRPASTTVATLATLDPSPVAGDIVSVTDATTCTANSVTTGGGHLTCLLTYSGAAWKPLVNVALNNTQNTIPLIQVFGPNTASPTQQLCGVVGVVWASNSEPLTCTQTYYYTPAYRFWKIPNGWVDTTGWSSNPYLDWLYYYHPDWIEYLSNQTTPVFEFGDPYPQMDIHNTAVQNFKLQELTANAQAFYGISFDNLNVNNAYAAVGHYASPTVVPCPPASRPACGGTWTAQYNGTLSDAQWTADNLAWITYFNSQLDTGGWKLLCNLGYQGGSAMLASAAQCSGGVLQESIPQSSNVNNTNYWYNGFAVDWLFTEALYDAENLSRLTPYFAVSYLNGHDTGGITQAEEEYNVAWVLLAGINPQNTFLSAALNGSITPPAYPPSMRGVLPIGHAISGPPIVSPYASPPTASCGVSGTNLNVNSGACSRQYSNGWVFMNGVCLSNGTSCTVASNPITVPAPPSGENWYDMFGNVVPPGSYTLPAATALVIAAAFSNPWATP